MKHSVRLDATAWIVASALAGATGLAMAQNAQKGAQKGAAAGPIKLGVLNQRSGVLGEMGAQNDVGIGMAVKEINAKGGVLGRQLEIVQGDDQSDPTQAVNEARRLTEREKVDVLYGPIGSQTAMAILPVVSQAGVANISVAGTTAFTPTVAPVSFSLLPGADTQGRHLADAAVDLYKAKRVAVLNDGGAQAKAAAEFIVARLKERKVEVTGQQEYPSGSQDMTPQLLTLRSGKPDHLIFFAQAGVDTGIVLKNMKDLGWTDIRITGNISTQSNTKIVMDRAGADAYKNVASAQYRVLSYCSGDKVGESEFPKFVNRIKAYAPDNFAKLSPVQVSYGYDSVYVLKAAIEGAQSTSGKAIAAWLEKNGSKLSGIQGRFSASPTSHFLVGQEALVLIENPNQKREDGLQKRVGC